MSGYRYKGLKNAEVIQGVIDATSPKECLENLKLRKIHVIWYYPESPIRLRHLSFQDSLTLCLHLEYLLKANLPLTSALEHVSAQSTTSLRKATLLIRKKIEGGVNLSTAIESEKVFFDPIFIDLIKTGEAHGNLAHSFSEIKHYLIWKNNFQKMLRQSLRYPFILFLLLIGLLVILNCFLVPSLRSFLITSGATQSFSTRALLKMTDVFVHYGPFIVSVILFSIITVSILLPIKQVKVIWHRFLVQCPGIGSFLMKLWIIKTSMNLHVLLKSGVFFPDALKTVSLQTTNLYLRSTLDGAIHELRNGASFSDALSTMASMPPFFCHFIKAGEESNNLADSFLRLGNYYSEGLRYEIDFLRDFLPVLSFIFIGGMLVWVVFALFYPLYNIVTIGP